MIRPIVKLFFLAKATLEVGRERLEDCLDMVTARTSEYKSNSNDKLAEAKDRASQVANELSQHIWQRSEILESQVREKIRRQVADFSLGALGDSTEINELRAEIATLRAEISEIKQMKASV
ncbi:MAG: hypothetical protein SGJ27_18765 [Candidatus Melainabacteria bacterium]|nr:hypothetical protein [Candidatus Melainabacteria bacterium]